MLHGEEARFGAGRHAELGVDVLDVRADGLAGDAQGFIVFSPTDQLRATEEAMAAAMLAAEADG